MNSLIPFGGGDLLLKEQVDYIELHILPRITRDDYFALESIGEQLKQKLGD